MSFYFFLLLPCFELSDDGGVSISASTALLLDTSCFAGSMDADSNRSLKDSPPPLGPGANLQGVSR